MEAEAMLDGLYPYAVEMVQTDGSPTALKYRCMKHAGCPYIR